MTEAILLSAFTQFAHDVPDVSIGVYESIETFTGLLPQHTRAHVAFDWYPRCNN